MTSPQDGGPAVIVRRQPGAGVVEGGRKDRRSGPPRVGRRFGCAIPSVFSQPGLCGNDACEPVDRSRVEGDEGLVEDPQGTLLLDRRAPTDRCHR